MKLTVEELIFSFYHKNYVEEGQTFLEAYFENIDRGQLNAVLEAACRSLLSKDLLEEHGDTYRFKEELDEAIDTLHRSIATIKVSKFGDEGEEFLSFHQTHAGFHSHSLLHDGQIYDLEKVSQKGMFSLMERFLNIPVSGKDALELSTTYEMFEEIVSAAANGTPLPEGEQEKFGEVYELLKSTAGKMNSIILFGYDGQNNAVIQNVMFIINDEQTFYFAYRDGEELHLVRNGETEWQSFILESLMNINRNMTVAG